VFGNGGEDVDGQLVGVRVVHRHELDARVHKGRHEGQISRAPIKLSDDQPCLVLAASINGVRQFGTVRLLAALESTNSPTEPTYQLGQLSPKERFLRAYTP
jgi:hypothetical protein